MDGEGMKLWLEKVWSKHPGGLPKKTSLLVLLDMSVNKAQGIYA